MRLVVDNSKRIINATCKTSCSLFDPFTKECGIFKSIDTNSAAVYQRCSDKLPFIEDESNQEYTVSSDEDTLLFHAFKGEKQPSNSTYPMEPEYHPKRRDASWYISPDKTFGCWIINDYPRKFIIQKNSNKSTRQHYKSPVPLHDHKSSSSLASKMCWYVNRNGVGQYMLLIEDTLIPIH